MMSFMKKALVLIFAGTVLSACAEPKFTKTDDPSGGGKGAVPAADGSGDATGTLNQPGQPDSGSSGGGAPGGGGTAGGGTTPEIMPKVKFIGPPCVRGTNCVVQFELDKAYPKTVEFDWRTDDNLYLEPPPPGTAIYGRAGYHYVSTSGHALFQAGETKKVVYVQNINPDNVEIIIGVRMSRCQYGSTAGSCAEFFK